MITLITGLPGSGKTLFMLCHVKALAEKQGRAVYQNGITALTLPWEVLEHPEKWFSEVPNGAVIVIDEAQRIFRPRGNAAAVPPFVAELETHRHRGIDLVLVTQHPQLVDANVRRLVGQHFHSVRKFGTQFATVHEWSSCREVSKASIGDAVKHEFRYPAEAFGWYKSAELHTHKRRIPARVWFLFAAPVLIAVLIYFAGGRVTEMFKRKAPEPAGALTAKSGAAGSVKGLNGAPASIAGAPGAPLTAAAYVQAYVPRVSGLAYSAPAYDAVTTVARAPVPAACVRSTRECRCYTQDATRLDVPEKLCGDIVERGYFVPFEQKAASSGVAPAGAPTAATAATAGRGGAAQSSGGAGAASVGVAPVMAATVAGPLLPNRGAVTGGAAESLPPTAQRAAP